MLVARYTGRPVNKDNLANAVVCDIASTTGIYWSRELSECKGRMVSIVAGEVCHDSD
jgi:hypothetical protein